MILVDVFSKNRVGIYQSNSLVEDEDWYSMVRNSMIKISYVNRDFLKGADSLAKEGKNKAGMYLSWC